MATSKIYVAIQSGSSYDKKSKESFTFTKGVTRVREGHVLLKLAGQYFEPIDEHIHYDVETATKAPASRDGSRSSAAQRVATRVRRGRGTKAVAKPKPTAAPPVTPTPTPTPAPGGITLASLRGETSSTEGSGEPPATTAGEG